MERLTDVIYSQHGVAIRHTCLHTRVSDAQKNLYEVFLSAQEIAEQEQCT
jgi:hypothetical protein